MMRSLKIRGSLPALFLILAAFTPVGASVSLLGPVPDRSAVGFTVNTTVDGSDGDTDDGICDTGNPDDGHTGLCTLRAAIQQINATGGAPNTIDFDIGTGTPTITLTSGLPDVELPLSIDGATGGATRVEIKGPGAGVGSESSGFLFVSGGNTIKNLIVHSFNGSGIILSIEDGAPVTTGSTLEGTWLGLDKTGASAPNDKAGLLVESSGNTIGGTTAAARNVIDAVILFGSTGNVLKGNYIGTTTDGEATLGTGGGISLVFGASGNTIGGPGDDDGNVISGSGGNGISLLFGSAANTIQGNVIGTDKDGEAAVPNGVDGIHVSDGHANEILDNTISANGLTTGAGCAAFGSCDGVDIRDGSSGNTVAGNFIGTRTGGTAALGNHGNGVFIEAAASNVVGGDATAGDRNVISGNGFNGVVITGPAATSNTVSGNVIGLDGSSSGTTTLPNGGAGVFIAGAPANTIGGTTAGARNVISGNTAHGIAILLPGADLNAVFGNWIGLDKTGTGPAPNGGHGVFLDGAMGTKIGGPGPGDPNTIAFNGNDGVYVQAGIENTIQLNAIFENGGLGIDLGEDGVLPNDPGDGDGGANLHQNYPVITVIDVDGGSTTIEGMLNSLPGTTFAMEFFDNGMRDPSEYGEGEMVLSTMEVTTDPAGVAGFMFTVPGEHPNVTATATDPDGNTSEFSRGPGSLTVNRTSDQDDADPADAACDVDLGQPGDQCTLRAAIQQANVLPGENTIDFDIQGSGKTLLAPPVILPNAPLPPILDPVIIDGTTQQPDGLVVIDGSNAGGGVHGLHLRAGASTVKGLVVNRFGGHGFLIDTAGGNTLTGNRIGTDATGDADQGNGGDGLHIDNVPDNVVGGATPAERNVIAGNGGDGVEIAGGAARANTLQGNRIGTDLDGEDDLGNDGNGVRLTDAPDNLIGGVLPAERNVIGGNGANGVLLSGAGAAGNQVLGNWIGVDTDPTGTAAIPNDLDGIRLADARSTFVGGISAGHRNVISGNGESGVRLTGSASGNKIWGNWIGLDKGGTLGTPNGAHGVHVDGANDTEIGGDGDGEANRIGFNTGDGVYVQTGLRNAIRHNAIAFNGGLGIDLGTDGVTRNDTGDGDGGANDLQNFPLIEGRASLNAASDKVTGRLNSVPNRTYAVDVFANPAPDPTRFGEGAVFLQSLAVTTDAEGNATFEVTVAKTDLNLSATATDPDGNTSEFSGRVTVVVNSSADAPDADPTDGLCDTGGTIVRPGGGTEPECTLRAAIEEANADPDVSQIPFDISPGGTVHTISVGGAGGGALPTVLHPAVIDGTTQPGYAAGAPLIELDGTGAGVLANGLRLSGGASTVKGLVIRDFNGHGLRLDAPGGHVIHSNFIGTDASGIVSALEKTGVAFSNGGNGILISGSPDNQIGGTGAGQGNVISGNANAGVRIQGATATGNTVEGNIIGADKDGKTAAPNGTGVIIEGAPDNEIGTTAAGARNVISGNHTHGVSITGTEAKDNTVAGNYIGVDGTGAADLGNGYHGVFLSEAPSNTIGGTEVEARNVISANDSSGVAIRGASASANTVAGNYLGVGMAGTDSLGNADYGVWIHGAPGNTVGGDQASARNVISSNGLIGVLIKGANAFDNIVRANYVGTNAAGTAALGNGGSGVSFANAPGNQVGGDEAGHRNVISGNGSNGVLVSAFGGGNASGNRVQGNYIGTNAAGTGALGNKGVGVRIVGVPTITVGGLAAQPGRAPGNVISGNGASGVEITDKTATGITVRGNLIGTDKDGACTLNDLRCPLGNGGHGVSLSNAPSNTIGGSQAGALNVISGNHIAGVSISGADAISNTVRSNFIGVRNDSTTGIPNQIGGVRIADASRNVIGGTAREHGNIIRQNLSAGVSVTGTTAIRNAIRLNSILGNGRLLGEPGIDLNDDGVTPNDLGDGRRAQMDQDRGPNLSMNFPVGVTVAPDPADANRIWISGLLDTPSPEKAMVDLYNSSEVSRATMNDTRFGEGEVYIATVTPNAQGVFRHRMRKADLKHPFVSATATDEHGNTSEFSWVCADPDGNKNVDNDGDSLCDDWETTGIDYNGDGTVDLDLTKVDPNQKAERDTKDLFVEIDYMWDSNNHNEEPSDDGLKDVVAAFKAAPIDGKKGIQLHLLKDERLAHNNLFTFSIPGAGASPNDFNDYKLGDPVNPCGVGASDGHFGTPANRQGKQADADPANPAQCPNILGARRLAFRYVIFGHSYNDGLGAGSSGKAEGLSPNSGNDFLVTLGSWSNRSIRTNGGFAPAADDTATVVIGGTRRSVLAEARRHVEGGTLMHEFGHTLGLWHGGTNNDNCKPNYPSIMSYSLQLRDMVSNRVLDYSRKALRTLREGALNENLGLNGTADRLVIYNQPRGGAPDVRDIVPANTRPINWDGLAPPNDNNTSADVNNMGAGWCDGTGVNLTSLNDWAALIYSFRFSPDFGDGATRETPDSDIQEFTEDQANEGADLVDFDRDGSVNGEDNCPAYANPDQMDANNNNVGDVCEGPAADVVLNMALTPEASGAGETLTYTMHVRNFGPDATTAVTLTDSLDARLVFASVAATRGTCAEAGGVVTCQLGDFAVGDTAVVTLEATLAEDGFVRNAASAHGDLFDPLPFNNEAVVETGEATGTAVEEAPETSAEVPAEYRLYPNYPNPFNPETTIRFDVSAPGPATVTVYNARGRHVATLVDAVLAPGRYQVRFDAHGLPSGVYFYRIQAGAFRAVRQMVLLK